MVRADQHQYYVERARQSRKMAEQAADSGIRKVHLDFARRYEKAAARLEMEAD